jgi:polar amino acid transport system substrate-binding protein
MRSLRATVPLLVVLALSLAGCGSSGGSSGGGGNSPSANAAGSGVCAKNKTSGDLLAAICQKGTITVSTDPKYPPQSSLDTKTGKYVGFDIDVATDIAKRLGVNIAWQTPSWTLITSGHWNGRWDMSVGSMTPTNQRQKVLDFTQPYYYTPAVIVVNKANTTIHKPSDLDGKNVGVCSSCTYQDYLDHKLSIHGYHFNFQVNHANIHGYDTDTTALADLALGNGTRLDAVITSLTTAQGFIRAGNPVKIVGKPLYYEPEAVAFDKSSQLNPTSLVNAVNTIVGQMHSDGTLTKLSKKWYHGTDLTTKQGVIRSIH